MVKRIITAGIGLCVLLPFVIFSHTFMLLIFTSVLASMAVLEMIGCIIAGTEHNNMGASEENEIIAIFKGIKRFRAVIPSIIYTVLMQLLPRIAGETDRAFKLMLAATTVYCFVLFSVAVISDRRFTIVQACLTFAAVVYINLGFAALTLLRDMNHGMLCFMLVFLMAWITDGGAYFVGSKLGRHKLIVRVSPKKTVEGTVGGVISCIIFTVVFGFIAGMVTSAVPNYPALIIMSALVSIVSQMGDLIASLFKREFGIKDYGNVFPGHGGVMDRFDSNIVVAPFMFIMINALPFLTLFV